MILYLIQIGQFEYKSDNTDEPKNVPILTLEELVMKHCSFYPAVRHALLIALSLPSTACTVERSMRRCFEKNNLGFSTCIFGQFKLHFVQNII